ncbi:MULTISPECIES: hypothetical protein [Streptomyces]|uniref:N-acetyltransferase domain-containing protein n=1 Tax=Streptomyces cacaoi TaxID=1898 RepID=A0A4Y3QV53_STRCI|nr:MULTISPECIES: hypothetical protein [Streptomyces]GEB49092.1 hypothetical protein SCA03_16430 [Streptomyces cacaoi]
MAEVSSPAGEATAVWRWEVSRDPDEVHALLCACDAHQAAASGTSAPRRRPETTERRVRSGAVHLLRHGSRPAGMFTLSADASFTVAEAGFPHADRPLYLSRLSVAPEWLAGGSLVGLRCVRRALAVAAESGADALRSEVNPDLADTCALLHTLGFAQFGPTLSDEHGRRRAYLHRGLTPAAGGAD